MAPTEKRDRIMEVLGLLGILAAWIVVQVWILPKLGVHT